VVCLWLGGAKCGLLGGNVSWFFLISPPSVDFAETLSAASGLNLTSVFSLTSSAGSADFEGVLFCLLCLLFVYLRLLDVLNVR